MLTSAGTAAGIDAGLHLIRQEQGSTVATMVARRMVVPPHREGGQAQFIETPLPAITHGTLQPVLNRVLATLDRPHSVETMAEMARLLEDSDLGVDVIADRTGFGSSQTVRHHFAQRLSTTPAAYRGTFKSQLV